MAEEVSVRHTFGSHWLGARGLSILAALIADIGLVVLLLARWDYAPPANEVEWFWVIILATFGFYAILQIWTLATVTGRGDDFMAAMDKFIALSPLGIILVLEAYWLGAGNFHALSWRHHFVAILWAAFAVTDFFSTDITNQRLRSREFMTQSPVS
jgi:hypothetical protein